MAAGWRRCKKRAGSGLPDDLRRDPNRPGRVRGCTRQGMRCARAALSKTRETRRAPCAAARQSQAEMLLPLTKKLLASGLSFRRNLKASPWNRLLPLQDSVRASRAPGRTAPDSSRIGPPCAGAERRPGKCRDRGQHRRRNRESQHSFAPIANDHVNFPDSIRHRKASLWSC